MLKTPEKEVREKYEESDYDNFLDEAYGTFSIGYCTFDASEVLKECDPTAYRCGFADYQEEEEVYVCPICEDEYEDEESAMWCCQEQPTCPVCGEAYDTEEEAETCCEETNDCDGCEYEEKCGNPAGICNQI